MKQEVFGPGATKKSSQRGWCDAENTVSGVWGPILPRERLPQKTRVKCVEVSLTRRSRNQIALTAPGASATRRRASRFSTRPSAYDGSLRQLMIADFGHKEPTLLRTNHLRRSLTESTSSTWTGGMP